VTPIARRLIGSAASTVDRAFVAAIQMRQRSHRRRTEGAMSHDQRMERLARVRETYDAPELLASPDAFFPPPAPVAPHVRTVRRLPWGGECLALSWESACEPFAPLVRDAYLAHTHNRTAHARLYTSARAPRPAIILVHGYLAGQWAVEERAWPIRWMNHRGLDVALFVLPFHGVRGRPDGGVPPFPGSDPRFTNEGFRQAVADLRALMAVLRERGAPAVGVMGMSLGGYTTALLATLERELAFAVPLIPLASVADFAREQGRLGTGEHAALQHAALEAANHIVSPLARPRAIARERVLIVGAEADQVTPISHAERLAAHLDAPFLRAHGGHMLQLWRKEAFRAVREMLVRNGVL
jgi:pimeloyl-ACP methyl ester carboxylesterase